MHGHHLHRGAAALVVATLQGRVVEEFVQLGRLGVLLAHFVAREHQDARELAARRDQFLQVLLARYATFTAFLGNGKP